MSIYRKFEVRMWSDANVRALTPPQPCGQSLWIRILFGEHTGIIPGLSQVREGGLADALGWSLEDFRKAFREVSGEEFRDTGKGSPKALVKADWEAGLLWIPKAIERNKPQAPNVVKSWGEAWDLLPECDLKIEAYHELRAFVQGMSDAFLKAFDDTIPKPSWKPSLKVCRNQEQEQEQEQDLPPKAPQGAGLSFRPDNDFVAPGLWERFDGSRATEYLAELAEHWPKLSVPAGRQREAAQGLFTHFADLDAAARSDALRRLAETYQGPPKHPSRVHDFLASSDLTRVISGPAKTTGYVDVPTEGHEAGELTLP